MNTEIEIRNVPDTEINQEQKKQRRREKIEVGA
jgi:hypothetical protein